MYPFLAGIAAVKSLMLRSATARGVINRAQLAAALQDGADLDQILQLGQNRDLLRRPVEVIAFCDEEGVRWGLHVVGTGSTFVCVLSALGVQGREHAPQLTNVQLLACGLETMSLYAVAHNERVTP